MKQVLTDITIWTGAIIGTLTILDWLLNDRQKNHLRRLGDGLWLWLADQKGGKFIQAFTAYKVQLLISVTLWGLSTVGTILFTTAVLPIALHRRFCSRRVPAVF